MVSAILSVILGVLPFAGAPIVASVLGLALAANAMMKESRLADRKPVQRYIAMGGCVICTCSVATFFLLR